MLALLAALTLVAIDPVENGPWRQLIAFQPTEERPDGTSLWIAEDVVLPPDGPSTKETRTVRELWVNSGATVGGQDYLIRDSRYDCAEGDIFIDRVEAFSRDGRSLGVATPHGEPDHPIPHSAESEIYRAVCDGSRLAARGATAATTAEAVALAGPGREIETQTSFRYDVNYDGLDDIVSIDMRPHSMRHDVEFVLAPDLNRTINAIAAEQPPRGPLVERRIRPLERDRYLIACEMQEGEDVTPCKPDYVLAQRGVEVVTPGHPTIIVWLTQGEPHVARLP